jgi:pSer/pThr/pTyr-binding forkhead associated (FHA) protein
LPVVKTKAADRLAHAALVPLQPADQATRMAIRSDLTLIGRDEDCQVVIRSPGVSKVHCLLVRFGDRWVIRDLLSGEGTRLNGQPITIAPIGPGDELQIGEQQIRLDLAGAGPATDEVLPALPAVMLRGPDAEDALPIESVVTLFGSRAGCEIELSDDEIDPVHAAIVRTPEHVWLIDLVSGIGVRVNGKRVGRKPLRTRDRLELGPFAFEVTIGQPPMRDDRRPAVRGDRTAPLDAFDKIREELRLQVEGDKPVRGKEVPLPHAAGELEAIGRRLAPRPEELQALEESISEQRESLQQERLRLRSERDRLAAQAEQLESQRLSLAAQHDALAARGEELESQRQALSAQREQLALEQAEFGKQRSRFQTQREELDAAHEREVQDLADRSERLAVAEQETAAARNAVQAESQSLAELRTELEQAREDLARQQEEWQLTQSRQQSRRQELDQQREQLDQQAAQIEAQLQDLRQREQALEAQGQQLQQQQVKLKQLTESLEKRQQAISALEAELEQQRQFLDERRGQWSEQEKALGDRQTALETRHAELQRQAEQLGARRALMDQREAAVTQAEEELRSRRSELAEARSAVEGLRAELAAAQGQLTEQAKQLDTRRDHEERNRPCKDEQRLAEQRQVLETELRRQQVELEQARARLAADQDALIRQQAAARRAGGPTGVRPRWPLILTASLVLCVAAGWLTYYSWPKRYLATDTLKIQTIAFPPGPVLHGHLAGVLDGERIESVAQRLGVRREDLSLIGQVDADAGAIRLSVQASSGWVASAAGRELLQSYAQQVNDQAVMVTPSRQAELLEEQRQGLVLRRGELKNQIEQLTAGQTDSSALEHVRRLEEAAEQFQQTQQDLVARQTEIEARLQTLRGQTSEVRGTLDRAQLEKAYSASRELQQDLDQWRMQRRTFREELITALQSAMPRLEAIEQAVDKLQQVIAEQRNAQLPADVAPVLDAMTQAQAELNEVYSPFAGKWRDVLAAAQDVTDKPDEQDLLGRQTEGEGLLRQYLDDSQPMLTALQQQVQSLSAPGENAAQRTVAQNALSGQVSALVAAQAEFASAGARVALTSNFRLEAAAKTIRGLARRIAEQKSQIESALQADADRQADEQHDALICQTETELTDARKQERQALNEYWQVVEKLDVARKDEELLQGQWHNLELARVRLEQVEAQLTDLDEQIRALPDDIPQPDTAEYTSEAASEPIVLGRSRAGAAAIIAGAAVLVICCLGAGLATGVRRRGG